jgi:hypothetical protein
MPAIRYVKRKDIDVQKWDWCIHNAENGLIYAKSYYLDAMAVQWDAIIVGDYHAVMPIPWKKKYGIAYVYPPPFLQQLGLFYKVGCVDFDIDEILQLVRCSFRFGEYYFNYSNLNIKTYPRKNFIIKLSKTYEEIGAHYKADLKRDLRKAAQNNLTYSKTEDYKKAVNLFKSNFDRRSSNLSFRDYERIFKACGVLSEKGELLIREVKDSAQNLLSITLCLVDHRRIYYLLSTTTSEGRKKLANHFLIAHIIREFSSKEILLDFEGSDIIGIAHFFKSFGAEDQPYFFYKWNHLPWPLRLFKK